ncbi:uncharacterized protein E0L32_008964 [Thyridium curvatum]|uniref:Uncharacterized protein n=1 Tax=Thyridium curvatum TaxID=1093900 RepID=A0A507APT0_9PEZI|nr:uncharacterized protein E0L32_008964 [Thyridium curvatum]TPX09773.1 hypothetical protein E0L32_008964 [Thyridium curvatum]
MADENPSKDSPRSLKIDPAANQGRARASAMPDSPAGSGFRLRRSATVNDASRRHSWGPNTEFTYEPPTSPLRRSSNFSEIGQEARDILNPVPDPEWQNAPPQNSKWDSLPLALALLPPLGGALVPGGSAFVTDLMLLALGALFLHWTVTQPWIWYHSAQQVRVAEELDNDAAVESDLDGDDTPSLEAVPEDESVQPGQTTSEARNAALKELYRHEVLALMACFVFPLLGAWLLHAIRGQLTRPSEAVISNYNLTVFVLGAEIRPLRHMIKLIRARTLHLQRIVQTNPYQREGKATGEVAEQLQQLAERLDEIESRAEAAETAATQAGQKADRDQEEDAATKAKKRESLLREVRNQMQPELDAQSRAMRVYERRLNVLATHSQSQFKSINQRLNDAVTLAAAAARNRSSALSFFSWAANSLVSIAMVPIHLVVYILTWPYMTLTTYMGGDKQAPPDKSRRGARAHRNGALHSRSAERVQVRPQRR